MTGYNEDFGMRALPWRSAEITHWNFGDDWNEDE